MKLEQIKSMHDAGMLHGLFADVEHTVYHHPECPGSSSTFFKNVVKKSPRHALAALVSPENDSPALRLGSAFHCITAQPELFKQQYVGMPEGLKRDARTKAFQEFQAANEGKIILSQDEMAMISGMRDSVMSHKKARELVESSMQRGKVEFSGWWTDPETGVLCKIRPDLITPDGLVCDLKSTSAGDPWSFSKSLHDFGYHISAAMYLEGMSRITGELSEEFVLIVVEKAPPYAVATYRIEPSVLEKGGEEFRRAIRFYADCKSNNNWPAYGEDLMDISLPAYAWI